jgi:VPDSG-CTERM motif
MKALKYTILIAALASGLVLTAKADLILSPFGDIPKNGTGINGGNSDNQANNFFRLQTYIVAHPTFGSLDEPVNLTGFSYAVVHYGVGRGGVPGSGGGVAFFQITNNSDTFPQNGSGLNGFGGISRVDLFASPGVPDGGTTAMLLGAALGALGMARRFLKA